MPKLDLEAIEQTDRTGYPAPFAADVAGRFVRKLCDFSGFAAGQVVLKPGAMAAHRCWAEEDDELLIMIDGEVVLAEEQGETVLYPGDCVAFPKGVSDGHQLLNRSDRDCTFLAIGTTANGTRHYPDVDLVWDGPSKRYTHKDGTPY